MLQKWLESPLDFKKLPERKNYFKYLRSVQTQSEDGYVKPSESEKIQMYGPYIMTDLKKGFKYVWQVLQTKQSVFS